MKDNSGLQDKTAIGVGSLAAGISATVLTHPFDIIKTCMQGDVEQKKYTNAVASGRNLCKEYGVRAGMFKALGWRTSMICTTFFLVNNFKQIIAPKVWPHVLE